MSAQLAEGSRLQLGVGASFIPKRVSSTPALYILAEPVFMHTDRPPSLFVTWEGTGILGCGSIDVFGYLIDK
jgi:hypothetical protein